MRITVIGASLVLTLLLGAAGTTADEKPPANGKTGKPAVDVADDGFPTGNETPEGAAADLARAFIRRDEELFRSTCIKPFGGGESRKEYEKFLTAITEEMEREAEKKEPSPEGPKELKKVFAARHLSRKGPASFGYAAFDFQDVVFVDVGCLLHNGQRFLTRTLVIEEEKGKWRAHPLPDSSPLLSTGLNEEGDSTEDFTDAYSLTKPKTPKRPEDQ